MVPRPAGTWLLPYSNDGIEHVAPRARCGERFEFMKHNSLFFITDSRREHGIATR